MVVSDFASVGTGGISGSRKLGIMHRGDTNRYRNLVVRKEGTIRMIKVRPGQIWWYGPSGCSDRNYLLTLGATHGDDEDETWKCLEWVLCSGSGVFGTGSDRSMHHLTPEELNKYTLVGSVNEIIEKHYREHGAAIILNSEGE